MNALTLITTAALAFILTSVIGLWLIPVLRKLKYGQTILDIGPVWHKGKQGTPTMGGIMFIIGVVVSTSFGFFVGISTEYVSVSPVEMINHQKLIAGVIMALAFGFVGFLDDFIKVAKKRNLGLTAKQKTLMQAIICIAYLATMYLLGDTSTSVWFPFIGWWDLGIFYYPLMAVGIYFFVNAVNLTDGVDGLATTVTAVSALVLLIICGLLQYSGVSIFAISLAGSCLGFLVWNFYPAKVFMGDTGSMFLGGCLIAIAFSVGYPLILGLVGIIYICEALSVVLQVISFKTTGKRIFKMSPIHHHFEMCKWSEIKIVTVFSLVALIFGAVGIGAVYLLIS